jgi:hypothetical protein
MSYTVSPLRIAEDRESLLRLWRESLPDPRTGDAALRQYDWFYDGNPYGPTQTWLLANGQSDTVLGCLSFMPRRASAGEDSLNLGIGVDMAVDTKHRSLGPALGMMRAMLDGGHRSGIHTVLGAPNQKSYPVLIRAGYQLVDDIQFWVRPLRSAYKLRPIIKNDMLARGAGFLVDSTLAMPHLWRSLSIRRGYVDEIVESADERFDAMWNARAPRNEIIGEKTAGFLNWRYTAFGGPPYRYYCLMRREDRRLLGYVVFNAADKKVNVAELFCQSLDPTVLHSLLLGFSARMKQEGHESIIVRYLGPSWFGSSLKKAGFFSRGVSGKFVVWVSPDLPQKTRERLLSKENWFIFREEMDL